MPTCHKRWEFIHIANDLIFEQSFSNVKVRNREFQPGDLVVSRGSLFKAYTDFLKQQNLPLTAIERQGLVEVAKIEEPFRYCLILQRLPEEEFLVCYFTTYGGARTPRAIADPIHRFFAMGISNTQYPPGIPPLRVLPHWNDKEVSFVFTVPAVRKHIFETRSSLRWHVPPAELERLITYIKDRVRVFRNEHKQLRQQKGTNLRELVAELEKNNEQETKEVAPQVTPVPEARPRTMFDWAPTKIPPMTSASLPLKLNKVPLRRVPIGVLNSHNDLRWLYRSFDTDILYRSSPYINSLKPTTRLLGHLPKPYYGPSPVAPAKAFRRWMRLKR